MSGSIVPIVAHAEKKHEEEEEDYKPDFSKPGFLEIVWKAGCDNWNGWCPGCGAEWFERPLEFDINRWPEDPEPTMGRAHAANCKYIELA